MAQLSSIFMMLLIFIIGIGCVIQSIRLSGSLSNDCKSGKLRAANRGVLVIGAVFATIPIAYMVCHLNCDCGVSKEQTEDSTMRIWGLLILALGITLISLGAIIEKERGNTNCDLSKDISQSIWGSGTVITVLSIVYLVSQLFEIGKTPAQKKAEQASQKILKEARGGKDDASVKRTDIALADWVPSRTKSSFRF